MVGNGRPLSLTFSNQTFDVAIDKGTLDAMLDGSLWDVEVSVRENVRTYVDEVVRVLKPRGKWLIVAYKQPHFLRPLVEREGVLEYVGLVTTKHLG